MINNSYLINKYPCIEVSGSFSRNKHCIIESRVHGLFACFYCILYGLFICEKEGLEPIIFLGENHLYYDQKYGNNIFTYFYTQELRPNDEMGKITVIHPQIFLYWCRISTTEKKISNYLIQKNFILNKKIKEIIDSFFNENMAGFRTIGVHFRGRDKIEETAVAPFEEYEKRMDNILNRNICDKIFFSTDELDLRDYVKNRYRSRLILYHLEGNYNNVGDSMHEGLHFSGNTPYLHAKDALIECYLLSKCNLLMSSYKSSMSLFATFFNPNISHIIIEP